MRPPSLEQPPWTSHDPDGPSETRAVDLRAKHRIDPKKHHLGYHLGYQNPPPFVMYFLVSMTSFFENQANRIKMFHVFHGFVSSDFSLPPTLLLKLFDKNPVTVGDIGPNCFQNGLQGLFLTRCTAQLEQRLSSHEGRLCCGSRVV